MTRTKVLTLLNQFEVQTWAPAQDCHKQLFLSSCYWGFSVYKMSKKIHGWDWFLLRFRVKCESMKSLNSTSSSVSCDLPWNISNRKVAKLQNTFKEFSPKALNFFWMQWWKFTLIGRHLIWSSSNHCSHLHWLRAQNVPRQTDALPSN